MEAGTIELVTAFAGSMPSGVTITPAGRTFLCFPRWSGWLDYTVAELMPGGELASYPPAETNRISLCDRAAHFFSVQAVVAAGDETLWVLDTGRPYFTPALPGAAKLVAIDLRTNRIRRAYVIPYGTLRLSSYLNDVRFDFDRGRCGTAYVTDSATLGRSALITIDLATGSTMRRLENHVSLQSDERVTPYVESRPLVFRTPLGISFPYRFGADGIALSPSCETLYYCALIGRRLYSVDAALLADPGASDACVAASVRDLGKKCVSDGLECDAHGRIYAGDLENRRIAVRADDGSWQTVVRDDRILWADTLAIDAAGRFLYFTATQVHRLWPFNGGRDCRRPPYYLFRTPLS